MSGIVAAIMIYMVASGTYLIGWHYGKEYRNQERYHKGFNDALDAKDTGERDTGYHLKKN